MAFHERGLGLSVDRFMRVLPHYYGVELHNFNPNSIVQAAIFVVVCEGYLGIAPHWELWLHFFRAWLNTKPAGTTGTRKALRASGCTLQPERWRYGIPLADQAKLQPLLKALERLRSRGLTTAMVVVAFHRRRVLSLMAWRQRLFEMTPRDEGCASLLTARSQGRRVAAVNRAHAEAYKERKDTEEARRRRKSLERDELEKHRRQQRHDGLLEEPSPSPSSMDSESDDDESEARRGPLDHLPNVREMAPRASARGPASPGGGGEGASGLAIARPGAEADVPEIRASEKRARAEEALDSGKGRPVPANTGAMPPSPPPPSSWTRDAVQKLLCPHSSQKHQAEAPALAPRKALKAALRRGAVSARADPKELVAQGEATEAATKQAGEEAPTPYEVGALELGEAEAPLIVEATKGEAEAPRTSEAEVTEAEASRASEAEVVDAGAPRTTEAEVAEARVPGTTEAEAAEAGLGAAKPTAQDMKTEVGQALEVADTEAASTAEQPALPSSEGSSALVWVQPEPCGWDSPRVLWQSRDDPEGEPLFALEDAGEGRRWGSLKQFCQLAERSLRIALSVVADDLPRVAQELEARSLGKSMFLRWERDVWDQLRQQKDLLANANELLAREGGFQGDRGLLGLEKEVTRVAEASVAVQAVLEAEIWEHNALQGTARTTCEALEGALHTGVKRALAVVSSHYAGIDLEAVSDGYIVADDDEKAKEEVIKLVEVAEAPGTALARLFEEEWIDDADKFDHMYLLFDDWFRGRHPREHFKAAAAADGTSGEPRARGPARPRGTAVQRERGARRGLGGDVAQAAERGARRGRGGGEAWAWARARRRGRPRAGEGAGGGGGTWLG
ncbi:uncharacterized protein [Miscanthus floridulus]|uniref:uncharacterized protein n=1 Tax=Miscanthus floridulus TaxID=154761 RepID=UPI003457BDC6